MRVAGVSLALLVGTLACRSETSEQLGAPKIVVEPASLALAADQVGEPVTRVVTVESVGQGPLAITRLEIRGDTRSAFSADGISGVKLSRGGRMEVRVTYVAASPGAIDSATLEIESDATDTPAVVVPLQGSGPSAVPDAGGGEPDAIDGDDAAEEPDSAIEDAGIEDLGVDAGTLDPCTEKFSEPASLDTNASLDVGDDEQVDLAIDDNGHLVAVWHTNELAPAMDTDIVFAHSTDKGATWTAPLALDMNALVDAASDERPRIANDGADTWIVVWESRNQLSGMGTDRDIFMARSIDDGMTWSPPEAMNTGADTDELDDSGPEIAADRNGRWVMTWRSPLNAIVSRRSENGGETWLPISPVALQADGDSESPPDLATDGLGNWVAAWHSHNSLNDTIGTEGDIAFSRSTDGGASWSVLAPINGDAATDSKSDEVVHLATDAFGNWIAVWSVFESPEIYAARSNDGGATWLPPELISADTGINFSLPQIGSDFRGTWYAIWASNNPRGGDLDLLVSTTTDHNAGWTVPEYLNTDAETDLGDDYLARIVFDRQGNGVAAWSADNSLGGMNGEDGDVLRALRTCE